MTRATPTHDPEPRHRPRAAGVGRGAGARTGDDRRRVHDHGRDVRWTGLVGPHDRQRDTRDRGSGGHDHPADDVRARAGGTTAPFDRGGGAITCSAVPGTPDDGSASSPPMTDTTMPGDGPPLGPVPIEPDAAHGLVRVATTGGAHCADSACPAIGIIMAGRVDLRPLDRADPSGSSDLHADLDQAGSAFVLAPPGRYKVSATTDVGSCTPATVVVTAGQTQQVPLACSVPYP